MNTFTLFGRVGRDPEVRKTTNGTSVANFSLATENGKKDGAKMEPTWHNLAAFGKTADLVEKYVHKGDQLLVEGRIATSKRQVGDKEITQVNLYVNRIEFAGGRSTASAGANGSATPAARRGGGPAPVDDDDIPF